MSSNRPHLAVDDWLRKLDLPIYYEKFKNYNGVEEMLNISEGEMKTMGIHNGSHRARLATSLTVLKEKYRRAVGMNSPNKSPNTDDSNARSFESYSPSHTSASSGPGVRSWPSTSQSSLSSTRNSSHRSSMEGCFGHDATPEDLKKALERELSLDGSDLRSYPWYHGTILRQRAEELVGNEGDFIVRDCISQPGDFVITCKWKNAPLHFIINKVINQPNTLYEKIQYRFEGDSFDSISDFITYYVGSKCPLSAGCGAVISTPINRSMPLSYYSFRYGIQCQIHYAAKALVNVSPLHSRSVDSSCYSPNANCDSNLNSELANSSFPSLHYESSPIGRRNLVKVSSDPSIDLNTEKKAFENRPNSGIFSSEAGYNLVSSSANQKPPPKPSRVPSKKLAQRPAMLLKWERKRIPPSPQEFGYDLKFQTDNGNYVRHQGMYRRMISNETRFSFLDRPSVSSEDSLSDGEINDAAEFTVPTLIQESCFDPANYSSSLLSYMNKPLESSVLQEIKTLLLTRSAKALALHLTRIDLNVMKTVDNEDLGLGVTSGLELIILPQGQQLIDDLIERTSCMKLLVAISILTCSAEEEKVSILNKWIEIATETKKTLGNLYGFSGIMLGLTLPQISSLLSTWLSLRRQHTENAFDFETKLTPALKEMQGAITQTLPNTCAPFILTSLYILQHYNNNNSATMDSSSLNFGLVGEQNNADYGLEVIENHMEMCRNISQQWAVFQNNAALSLSNVIYDDALLEIFKTDFHLRLFWGFNGANVSAAERHDKFTKVLHVLAKRCQ